MVSRGRGNGENMVGISDSMRVEWAVRKGEADMDGGGGRKGYLLCYFHSSVLLLGYGA